MSGDFLLTISQYKRGHYTTLALFQFVYDFPSKFDKGFASLELNNEKFLICKHIQRKVIKILFKIFFMKQSIIFIY